MRALSSILLLTALGARANRYADTQQSACRDRFIWPFSQASIWNTPIGSGAVYVPAKIFANNSTDLPTEFHNDQEWPIRAAATDPLVDWMDDSGNFPGGCGVTAPVKTQLPMPADFVTDCDANNNGAGLLLPDNRTLVQMQPLYRAASSGPFLAWYHTGAPQPFPWTVDVLGNGTWGAHGGSGLSSFGGAIRQGELLPTYGPIAHALKLELWAHRWYYFNYSSGDYASCYTWPAVGCDSYWDQPGVGYNGTHPHLKPGALLAVPPADAPAVAAGLTTVPGRKLLDALTDYGGYIVDDTGSAEGGGAFCAEHAVNDEVLATYGYSIAIGDPLRPTGSGSPLYWDLVRIYQALAVVVNNGPSSVGGGGNPLKPLAPPICGAAAEAPPQPDSWPANDASSSA